MALRFLVFFVCIFSHFVDAQELASTARYLTRIELHSAEELNGALMRAEELFATDRFKAGTDAPVVFVLHGPEARTLLNSEYKLNKSLVDLAARLSAFQIVDVRVCKTWMGGEGIVENQLPPFVSTVPYGPEEKRRLLSDEQYVYF